MKRSHILLIGLIAIAIGVIISTAGDSSSYETFKVAKENPDQEFHVVGKLVKDKPMVYNPEKDANLFSFYLEDGNQEIHQVVYHGTKPQDFERSEQVVLIGHMKNEAFDAQKILTKCPSKYVEKNVNVADAAKK